MILCHKSCPQFWLPSKVFQGMKLTKNRPYVICPRYHLHSAQAEPSPINPWQVELNAKALEHISGCRVQKQPKILFKYGLAK